MIFISVLLLLKEINMNACISNDNNEKRMVLEDKKICNSSSILEEGFICCNSTICDKYCYNDICISQNKVWFCFDNIGIYGFFAIKISLSIIFLFLSIITRIFWKDYNQIPFLLCILMIELFINSVLMGLILFTYCQEDFLLIILLGLPLYFVVCLMAFMFKTGFFESGENKICKFKESSSTEMEMDRYYPLSHKIRIVFRYSIDIISVTFLCFK